MCAGGEGNQLMMPQVVLGFMALITQL